MVKGRGHRRRHRPTRRHHHSCGGGATCVWGLLWLMVPYQCVLQQQGRSLLAVGVKAVQGEFMRGEVVACVDEAGNEIARGLVNYGADEIQKIKGQASDRIESILGYLGEPELIHRDNLVLI